MIKVETIGAIEVAKLNPILTSETATPNYSFMEDNGRTYLIANTLAGDLAYTEDAVIPAGEKLNGWDMAAWDGLKLVIDGKHITDGIDDLDVGDTLVIANGKLKAAEADGGIYLVVTDFVTLTEKAVKALVVVEPAAD